MNTQEKESNYKLLLAQLEALLEGESNALANLANASALLNQALPHSVFAGFTLWSKRVDFRSLQGQVSCVHIALGKGVCGEAAEKKRDAGHRGCDPACQLYLLWQSSHEWDWGPHGLEGPVAGSVGSRFGPVGDYDDLDRLYLERFVAILLEKTNWNFRMFGVVD